MHQGRSHNRSSSIRYHSNSIVPAVRDWGVPAWPVQNIRREVKARRKTRHWSQRIVWRPKVRRKAECRFRPKMMEAQEVLPDTGESCLRSAWENEFNCVDRENVCKYAPRRKPIENNNEKDKIGWKGSFCEVDSAEIRLKSIFSC